MYNFSNCIDYDVYVGFSFLLNNLLNDTIRIIEIPTEGQLFTKKEKFKFLTAILKTVCTYINFGLPLALLRKLIRIDSEKVYILAIKIILLFILKSVSCYGDYFLSEINLEPKIFEIVFLSKLIFILIFFLSEFLTILVFTALITTVVGTISDLPTFSL